MDKLTLLYVDDEEFNLTNFSYAFRDHFDIHTAASSEEALQILNELEEVALVVADQRMPGMNGTELLQEISRISPDTVRIMLTAYNDPPDIIAAINKGEVYSYLSKPWHIPTLQMDLNKAAERYRLQVQNKKLIRELSEKNQSLQKELHNGQRLREALIRRDMILGAVNETAQKLIRSRKWRPFTEQLLARLGVVMAASRIHIYSNYHDEHGHLMARQEFAWNADGYVNSNSAAIADDFDYARLDLQRWPALLASGSMLAVTVDEMPANEARRLKEIDIQAIACAPININNRVWGFICVQDCEAKRIWHDEELDAIKAVASLCGEAVHREEIEQNLNLRQDQLAHAGRLNVIGEMAAGMAHEIDEAMSIISLDADKFKDFFRNQEQGSSEIDIANDITRQVNKSMRIIEDLRGFASFSDKHLSNINPYWPTIKALSFFKEQFRLFLIELENDISEDLPTIKTDSQLYSQIVVNLLSNARYAVQKKAKLSAGHKMKVKISLRHESLNPEIQELLAAYPMAKDEMESVIILEVSDNGIGMDSKTMKLCTEPFFSTKASGEGTGLGLSVSQSLVEDLGFALTIDSTPGEGASFQVIMPVYEDQLTLMAGNTIKF
ncbi:MAG: response regulator [Thermodesulfobacteriota bacterium]